MLMGLLGTGYSVMEGRRREKVLRTNIASQNYRTQLMDDYVNRARYGTGPAIPFGLSTNSPEEGRVK
jgi:hypothetical protein